MKRKSSGELQIDYAIAEKVKNLFKKDFPATYERLTTFNLRGASKAEMFSAFNK